MICSCSRITPGVVAVLLRSLAILLVVSPVACMKVDWKYSDHRSTGDSAKEGAAGQEGKAALFVDLPAKVELGEAKVGFKLWPADKCDGTKEEKALGADEFPHTVWVDSSCDYQVTFALGTDEAGEPVDVSGNDLAEVGADGLVVDVVLANASGAADTATATGSGTQTVTGTETGTETGTGTATNTATVGSPTSELGIKELHIPAGTGNKAWNTRGTPMVARVGDTIRIFNDDTTTHRLHTNGRPCQHGNDIRPGQSSDCVVQSQFDGELYDHNTNGAVFIQATR